MQAPNGGPSVVWSQIYDDVSRNSFIRILLQNVRIDCSRTFNEPYEYLISIWRRHVIWTPAGIHPCWRALVTCYASTEPGSRIRKRNLDHPKRKQQNILWNLKQKKCESHGGKDKYISSSSPFFMISWHQITGSTFLGKDSWSCKPSLSHCSDLLHSFST
jgi:hypothetical protein